MQLKTATRTGLLWMLIVASGVAACETGSDRPKFDPALEELVSADLWKASNHGRIPLGKDGYFAFPENVRRVVIDVGAYKLRRTRGFLKKDHHTAIVAIEPLSEPWKFWPDDPRVIGVPVAISLERGMLEFNVSSTDVTSSLLEPTQDNLSGSKTVDVRQVPGVRLEDIFDRIPEYFAVIYLKTDIQGMDLAALMSAGEQLRRVKKVQSEIINFKSYEKNGAGSMASEKEFNDYMESMGFVFSSEVAAPQRWYLDAYYDNQHWKRPPKRR